MQSMDSRLEHGDNHHDGDGIVDEMNLKLDSDAFKRAFELDLAPIDHKAIEKATRSILAAVGEDPEREGLLKTPNRIARMYDELLSGYRTDPNKLLNGALFEVEYSDMVIVRDIEFSSLCEHHMLPFIGRTHVAYIPRKKVIGLSKIPRIVDMFARRLQVQERMTRQIASTIQDAVDPLGVGVVMEGTHLCMAMRGVEKQQSSAVTSAMLGTFREDARTRTEFLTLIRRA